MSDYERAAERLFRLATIRGETFSIPMLAAILREEFPKRDEQALSDKWSDYWHKFWVDSNPAPDVTALREAMSKAMLRILGDNYFAEVDYILRQPEFAALLRSEPKEEP